MRGLSRQSLAHRAGSYCHKWLIPPDIDTDDQQSECKLNNNLWCTCLRWNLLSNEVGARHPEVLGDDASSVHACFSAG